MAQIKTLNKLIPIHLKPLQALEKKLLELVPLGKEVSDFEPNKPLDMAQIGGAQTIRSEFLEWLLTNPDAQEYVHHKGVNLRGAQIVGSLDLQDSNISSPLRLRNCIIEHTMLLERGQFILLDFSGSQTGSIRARSIKIQKDLWMTSGFNAVGGIILARSSIEGNLYCDGGRFENPGGDALNCAGLSVKGSVSLMDGFKAKGKVWFIAANIGGEFCCDGGEFENSGRDALICDSLTIKTNVYLCEGFKAKGVVRFVRANIEGSLYCDGGKFENPGGDALLCSGLTTQGDVVLTGGFEANGNVRFLGANIGGEFNTKNGIFRAQLDFRKATLSQLLDNETSWPGPGELLIDGLVYGPFSSDVSANSKARLKWLRLQNPNNLNVQPYEQLTSVFRQMGLRDDARDIAIAKQRVIRKRLIGISKLWSWILDITLGYGFRIERALLLMLFIIFLGSCVFYQAFSNGIMKPTEKNYQWPQQTSQYELEGTDLVWQSAAYSLDVFLPVVDFHQENAWMPNITVQNGYYIQGYMFFHILAGWFFTSLAVAAVTGLVRSD